MIETHAGHYTVRTARMRPPSSCGLEWQCTVTRSHNRTEDECHDLTCKKYRTVASSAEVAS
jgi:hypothetical protein